HYKATEAAADAVYRWWYITSVQKIDATQAYLFVDRPIQRASDVVTTRPLLFLDRHLTNDGDALDARSLDYVIAPGAWVSALRDAVGSDARSTLLAPGDAGLNTGDDITNPPGGDVWHPTGFRVRHRHYYPSMGAASSFESNNLGRVQVGNGLFVTAGGVA